MKTSLLYFIVLLISLCCYYSCEKDTNNENDTDDERPTFSLEQADSIPNEEYKIYSFVIDELFENFRIVIRQQTNTIFVSSSNYRYYFDILLENNPDVDSNLIDIYTIRNDSLYYFDNHFACDGKEIILISNAEFQYIFRWEDRDLGWEEFYDTYPGSDGIIEFTRIGFNKNHTQAILEIGHQAASLFGSGGLIYLERIDNRWHLGDIISTWIS